jgi:hypothetical protein
MRLELSQECQQVGVVAPAFPFSVGHAHVECFCLHLQIYFSVNIGGFYRYVPEPVADCVDIDARAKEMSGRRVADGVRPDALFSELRVIHSEFANVPGDDVMDAKTSQRLPVAAEEHSLVIRLAAGELFQFAREQLACGEG